MNIYRGQSMHTICPRYYGLKGEEEKWVLEKIF